MRMMAKPKAGSSPRHPEHGYMVRGEMEVTVDKGIKRLQKSGEIILEKIQDKKKKEENKANGGK